jgi:hypothetical protein
MAISDAQKVDLLYKKYFGVAKTDTSTNKGAGNESIPSSVFVRNDKLWYQSGSIPGVAANVPGIIQPYLTTQRVSLSADNTTTPVSNVFPTWKSNLTDWVPPEFGATYAVKIYAENGGNTDPTANTSLSDSGIGGVGEWNFDYQSGVLNFIGGTIPAVLTGSLNQTKVLYLTGYRYVGAVGAPSTTDIVANVANVILSISNVSQSITELTNRLTANIITANVIITDYISANTLLAGNIFAKNITADVITANSYVSTGAGVPTLSSATNINLSANGAVVIQSSPLRLKTYNLPEANALAASSGDIVYLSNTNTVNSFDGTSWVQIGEKLINARVTDTVYATNVIATGRLQANSLFIAGLDVTNNVLANNISAAAFSGNSITVDSITANIWNRLYTANVIETNNNLFYTNARVLSNVSAMSINVLADVDITGIQNNGILIWNGTQFAAGSVSASATSNTALFAYLAAFANTAGVSNVALLANQANTSYFANVADSVLTLSNFTTANLAEGVNLYYTNARVVSALTPLLTTANVLELSNNLYYTDARVNVAVRPILTTANVIETSSNLYFTAARVNATVQPFLTTANVVETSGNLYFTEARVNATVQPFLTTANVRETSGNLYFTNARVLAALYNADLKLGNVNSITSTTSTFVANTITANTLTISGNATIGSGTGGTLSGLAYLYSTNVIANVLFANTIAPTRVTGNLVVDTNLFANGFVLQGTDLTNSLLNLNSSNVIYAISAEQSNVNYSANLKLTGTNNGNVTIQDQVSFKGTGLVRISRQDSDTIVINAGIAPVVATPVANTATEVTRFSTGSYRTAEFIYTSNTSSYTNASYANLYNAGKILLLHDGAEVIFTQYAILQTGNGLELAAFSATINNGNVILYATAADGVTATVKLSGTTYTEI